MANEENNVNPTSGAPAVAPAGAPSPSMPKQPEKVVEPKVEAKVEPVEPKNVFSELFGKKDGEVGGGIMDAAANKDTAQKKQFFTGTGDNGEALKKMKTAGKRSFTVEKSKPGKIMLQVAFLLLVLTGGFFYTQNSLNFSWFGSNVAQKAENAQEQVDRLEAEIYVQKHLSAVLLLDKYSTLADEYFYNLAQSKSAYVSQNKRESYEIQVKNAEPNLVELLRQTQQLLNVEGPANGLALPKVVVDELVTALHAKSGEVDEQTLLQDIQDLESTKLLMQSKDFKTGVLSIDPETASEEDFEFVFDGFGEINSNVSSLIAMIKRERTMWSVYLEEIKALTKDVDPLFETEFKGSLTLNDIKFEASSGTVTVSGSSLTNDTKNFTVVSTLIDTYESSDMFENAMDRSYTKSDSGEDSYTGNFRISMNIEIQE